MNYCQEEILKMNIISESQTCAPFIGVRKHCLLTDGNGVTTLAAFHGCPLSCKYCLNPQCKDDSKIWKHMTPSQLYDYVKDDDIYFQATGGGIVFGGGEPLLYPLFIKQFSEQYNPNKWKISIESSLNVNNEYLRELLPHVDEYIVDIKDMSSRVYMSYTGENNRRVIENLKYLITEGVSDRIIVRVPHISGFNTDEDVKQSVSMLQRMGIKSIEEFQYVSDRRNECRSCQSIKRGKVVCNVLKKIRTLIAEANNIEYNSGECNNTGLCAGTCPKCDAELSYLTKEIYKLKHAGVAIKL